MWSREVVLAATFSVVYFTLYIIRDDRSGRPLTVHPPPSLSRATEPPSVDCLIQQRTAIAVEKVSDLLRVDLQMKLSR